MRRWPSLLLLLAGCAEPPAGRADDASDRLRIDLDDCSTVVRAGDGLQAAIDAAADGDTICVAAGTWVENLDLTGRVLDLVGIGANRAVLDGGGLGPVVTIVDATVELSGFTITNGASATDGGGLYVGQQFGATNVELADLIVSDNVAAGSGGGLYAVHANVTAEGVLFLRNEATVGGGVAVSEASFVGEEVAIGFNTAADAGGGASAGRSAFTLTNADVRGNVAGFRGGGLDLFSSGGPIVATVIAGNDSGGDGGGIAVAGYNDLSLVNVVLARNEGAEGGAIWSAAYANVDVVNSAIVGNTSGGTGGVFLAEPASTATFAYTDLWHNGVNVNTGDDPVGENGNLSVNPRFVRVAGANPARWDFHLRPDSPLIDAGDPAVSDPDGTRSDIGAYGGPSADVEADEPEPAGG